MKKMLVENPFQLVKFNQFKRKFQVNQVKKKDRRLTRAKNQNSLPIGAWAGWVVECEYRKGVADGLTDFDNAADPGISRRLIVDHPIPDPPPSSPHKPPPFKTFSSYLSVSILSCPVSMQVGLLAPSKCMADLEEWREARSAHWSTFQLISIIDTISVVVFFGEIALKWLDDFSAFWQDGWNIFDLAITLLSAIPNIIDVFGVGAGGQNAELNNVLVQMRAFRIIRTLKIVCAASIRGIP